MSVIVKDMTNPSDFPNNSLIAIDTGIVLGLTKNSRETDDYFICKTFMDIAIEKNNIICITSKTAEELKCICESIEFPNNKKDIKSTLAYLNNSDTHFNLIINAFRKFPNFYPEFLGDDILPKELTTKVRENSRNHRLRNNDAVIFTQAYESGCRTMCTLDKDWKNISDSEITLLIQPKHMKTEISNRTVDRI